LKERDRERVTLPLSLPSREGNKIWKLITNIRKGKINGTKGNPGHL
jgi:hypothetical protein